MVIEIIDFNMFEGAFEVIFKAIWGHLRSFKISLCFDMIGIECVRLLGTLYH